jgi:putative peptidoglycan lipid II flippase
LTLPAAVALTLIPNEIVKVLFERGAFGAEARQATAAALAAFASGLPAYVLIKVLRPAFYAREDTVTPFRYAVAAMIANTVLGLILFAILGFVGIAIATAVASWLNVALLWSRLNRSGFLEIDARLRRKGKQILLSSIGMGAGLLLGANALASAWTAPATWRITALSALVGGGAALYFALALLIGAIEPLPLRALIRRSFGRASTP